MNYMGWHLYIIKGHLSIPLLAALGGGELTWVDTRKWRCPIKFNIVYLTTRTGAGFCCCRWIWSSEESHPIATTLVTLWQAEEEEEEGISSERRDDGSYNILIPFTRLTWTHHHHHQQQQQQKKNLPYLPTYLCAKRETSVTNKINKIIRAEYSNRIRVLNLRN